MSTLTPSNYRNAGGDRKHDCCSSCWISSFFLCLKNVYPANWIWRLKFRCLSASRLSYNDAQTRAKHLLLKLMYICTCILMTIQYHGPSYRHQQSHLSREGNGIQSSSRIIQKAKGLILGAKWISHLAPQFSISKIEKNSTSQCPKRGAGNYLGFCSLVHFSLYMKTDDGILWQRLNFFVENEKLVKIIVMADTFGWFNTFLIHLLRNCQGKHFKSIKYILSAYSQANCDYPKR